jgi:serine protease Do
MKIRYLIISIAILVILALVPGCGAVPEFSLSSASLPTTEQLPGESIDSNDSTCTPEVADTIKDILPAVVAIDVEIPASDSSGNPIIEQLSGSGWVLNPKGFIVTNNHVVAGARRVKVTLQDGHSYPAQIVGTDPVTDLAVIDIGVSNLAGVSIGDSSKTGVGEVVIAIGNAGGKEIRSAIGTLSSTCSTFVVENQKTYDNMLETSAPIAYGDSGGPLFNTDGEVIGIITGAEMSWYGMELAGYAISSNTALPVIQNLLRNR